MISFLFLSLFLEARATLQSIEDKAKKVTDALAGHEFEAKRVLDEIRNVAAEEGVTQQAAHFRAESEHHEGEAEKWRNQRGRTRMPLT